MTGRIDVSLYPDSYNSVQSSSLGTEAISGLLIFHSWGILPLNSDRLNRAIKVDVILPVVDLSINFYMIFNY